jgi:hypothetical protein
MFQISDITKVDSLLVSRLKDGATLLCGCSFRNIIQPIGHLSQLLCVSDLCQILEVSTRLFEFFVVFHTCRSH